MRLRRFTWLALLAATAVLAFGAATASSGSTAKPSLGPGATAKAKVGIRYTVKKFVRHGNRLVAYGTAIGRYIPASGATTTSRQPFKASVAVRGRRLAAAQTICPVLELTIQQLDLNLLGALVHLDKVHLLITADSQGGLLGDLLCKLSKQGKLSASTNQMTWALKKSGLATSGTGFTVAVQPSGSDGSGAGSTPKAVAPLVICPVLDLTLGPVDLNLLGLLVHLDTVHLTINADSDGGLLGSLLCSLAGTPTPTP
jgi:hypothetical protein